MDHLRSCGTKDLDGLIVALVRILSGIMTI